MASQTKSAGLGQSVTVGGRYAWTSPTNIYTSNNVYAYVDLDYDELTELLRASTFDFSIPGGATIDGVVAEFEKKADLEYTEDYECKILKQGTEQGDNKAKTGVDWPSSDTYVSYGGASDMWGVTLSPAEVNATNFGVSISATYIGEEGEASILEVDHVRITVYYTLPVNINIGDVFKGVTEVKINIGDSWKTVVKVQVNIGDSWKTVFG